MTFVVPWREEAKLKIERPCKVCGEELPLSNWEKDPVVKCPYCGEFNNREEIIEKDLEQFAPVPDIKIKWVRYQEYIRFNRPFLHFVLGDKGSGKSSLLEALAIRYPKVIDAFGSDDSEGLCWCKPEFEKIWKSIHGFSPSILLIKGRSKDVSCKWETCNPDELNLQKIKDHDIISTVRDFFSTEEEYFTAISKMIETLYQRKSWSEVWALLVREAGDWIQSRFAVVKDDKDAKRQFIKGLRHGRHKGVAIMLDSLRYKNLDKEVRDEADYTWIKCLGNVKLPEDLSFLYGIFQFHGVMRMKPDRFIISTRHAAIGFGKLDYPQWHKEEFEDILSLLNIEVRNSEKGTNEKSTEEAPQEKSFSCGAFEHEKIIQVYFETKSMLRTADKTDRGYKTIWNHINKHNDDVRNLGECKECFAAKTPFSKISILVKRAGRPKKEKAYQELNAQ